MCPPSAVEGRSGAAEASHVRSYRSDAAVAAAAMSTDLTELLRIICSIMTCCDPARLGAMVSSYVVCRLLTADCSQPNDRAAALARTSSVRPIIFARLSLPLEGVPGSKALNHGLYGRQAAYAGVVVGELYQGSGSALQLMSRALTVSLNPAFSQSVQLLNSGRIECCEVEKPSFFSQRGNMVVRNAHKVPRGTNRAPMSSSLEIPGTQSLSFAHKPTSEA